MIDWENDFLIDVSDFCGDSSGIDKTSKRIIKINKNYTYGFYKLNAFNKLVSVLTIKVNLRFLNVSLNKIEKIVIGNDGAIQRKIIENITKNNKCVQVEMWSDGLLEKHEITPALKISRLIRRVFSKLKKSYLINSEVGVSYFLNAVYVLTESCKKSLIYNGGNAEIIKVAEFPRIKQLLNNKRDNFKKRILLVVSAFAWHGRQDIENWEIETAKKFSNVYLEDVELSIRVHPRSSEELKNSIYSSGIASKYMDIDDDLCNSDIVISYASTSLLEAVLINRVVYVYENGAPYIDRGEFIETLDKINDFSQLKDLIKNV